MRFTEHKSFKTNGTEQELTGISIIEGVSDLTPEMNLSFMVHESDALFALSALKVADEDYWGCPDLHEWPYDDVLCVALEELNIKYVLFLPEQTDSKEEN